MKKIIGLQAAWQYSRNDNNNYEIGILSAQLNINFGIAGILFSRGYDTKQKAISFLFPLEEEFTHDPGLMHSLYEGVMRIKSAISNKEKILIFGDYDVDGITSTSLLLHALIECGADVNFFLPHRVHDGYGLSPRIVQKAKESKYDLIITVDNGTCAFEALKKGKEIGIDIIVTDHHQPQELLETPLYLINPHQKGCQYPFKGLAGVGVVFKLVTLLYNTYNKVISQKIYELFTLGTIADLVPLINENRYIVKYTLERIKCNESLPISLLKENAKFIKSKVLCSSDIAFSLAPQLNALGRLDNPRNGVIFFTNNNTEKLTTISMQLQTLNEERKKRADAL